MDENEKEKQRLIQLIEDLETKLRDRDRENRDRESEIRKEEFELESEKRKFETEKEIVFARLDHEREKIKVILGSGGTLRNIILSRRHIAQSSHLSKMTITNTL